MSRTALLRSEVAGFPCRRGKVRDVYDLGNELIIVATDRISAFDWILPTPIPDKGRILSALTRFWFDWLGVPHHLLSMNLDTFPKPFQDRSVELAGRAMRVRKTKVFPVECVVRGYLAGSGWKEYVRSGTVCGIDLPSGLLEGAELPEPIFTPATKAESGHDENIPFEIMVQQIGSEAAIELRNRSIEIYRRASAYARPRGVIIADTKFEWGSLPDGEIILIDEVLTPDSSRFWPVEGYRPGQAQPSFDKQFVRDWLETTSWDKNSEPPALPVEVVEKTKQKYERALQLLT